MRKFLIVIGFFFAAGAAHADTAAREAAAARLLEASDSAAMIDTIYDSMMPMFQGMAEEMGIEESQRPIFDRHMERVFAVLREEVSWEKMEPYMVAIYAEVYTADELNELAEFYESPLGQKMLAKMPELMEASMSMTQQMMAGFYSRMEELQGELVADIEASRSQ